MTTVQASATSPTAASAARRWSLYLLLGWIGLNLRATVLAVPPVLDRIEAGAGLTAATAGLLTAMPILVFGLTAIPGAALVSRLGGQRTVSLGLTLVVVGAAARALPIWGAVPLFVGTLVLSAGIGISQPALPRILAVWLPDRGQQASVVVAGGYILGQMVASLTVPVVLPLSGGWRGTLIAWSLPAAVALMLWMTRPSDSPDGGAGGAAGGIGAIAHSPLLWISAALMACTNLVFFTATSWLPRSAPGGTEGAAATLDLVLLNVASLATTLALSTVRHPFSGSHRYYVGAAIPMLAGSLGWLADPGLGALWAILIGCGNAMAFTGLVAYPATLSHRNQIAPFSALLWTLGCAGAFIGPLVGGIEIQATGWTRAPMVPVAIASALVALLAVLLPSARTRHERLTP